jgi:DNA-binding NarL/FixJ family response regulator
MSSAISSLNQNVSSVAIDASSNPVPAARPQPAANVATDTVQLTAAQQVYQLYNQGQTVSQIASSLSLTEAVVNGYLNVTSTG